MITGSLGATDFFSAVERGAALKLDPWVLAAVLGAATKGAELEGIAAKPFSIRSAVLRSRE